ncbi:MAG TPA: NAD(P)H-binding protein [Kofleriaceae bacterium]|jgi:uncharacterized protein YbjT (DUF2867 family)
MRTVLVVGATGTVGRELVNQLVSTTSSHDVAVRALVREPSSTVLPASVDVVRGDLTRPETLEPALDNVDAVFLVWATSPATAPAVIERIASHSPRLVLLTAPHQTQHPFFQQPNPMQAMLAGIERCVEATSLAYTFIRPHMFADNCIGWWGDPIRKREVVRWPLLAAPTAPIDPRDIAAVAAKILADASGTHARESYVVTGPASLTQRDQLQIIADALGRPVPVEELTLDEARRMIPFPPAALEMLLGAWQAALGQPAYVTTTVAELLGRDARTFREWADHNAAAFR